MNISTFLWFTAMCISLSLYLYTSISRETNTIERITILEEKIKKIEEEIRKND